MRVYFFLFLFLLVACSNSDSKVCVQTKTIKINSVPQEAAFDGLKLVFSNDHFKVYFSKYASVNGDMIRDGSGLYIVNQNTGVAYSSYDFFSGEIPETVSDPTDFFTVASLKISNNCEQVFFSDDINNFMWFPGNPSSIAEGIYHAELKLKLADNSDVSVKTNFEIIKYGL
ncbi:MAG: hypothetical protein JST78_01270 [Bacteroidetes bacterium]|nr:hypothetical protein [Bacteroidota bacterium]